MRRPYHAPLALIPAGLLFSTTLAAYNVNQAEVRHDNGSYSVSFDMQLDADAVRVRDLMTDYDHLDRLSGIVIRSRVLAVHPDGGKRIRLDMRACVLFLCKTVRRVQDVALQPNGDITASAVPALSDFSRAEEHWRIIPQGSGTRIHYDAQLVPDFFVPPMLGPWLLKRAIRRDLLGAAARIESLAAIPHAR